MNALEKKARALAIAWLNEQRAAAGLPPIKRLLPLWWSMYGREWIAKAKRAARGRAT